MQEILETIQLNTGCFLLICCTMITRTFLLLSLYKSIHTHVSVSKTGKPLYCLRAVSEDTLALQVPLNLTLLDLNCILESTEVSNFISKLMSDMNIWPH